MTETVKHAPVSWIELQSLNDIAFIAEVETRLCDLRIGQRIKEIREVKNLTQSQIARFARISQSQLAALESGKNINPELATLMKIAIVLDVQLFVTFEDFD
ncbi:MAG: helix-turn-helix domain-containing protein [Candidatus Doudnabacteria bacterium]|nr:helix-turn-helix domain-containing protein [Candidatus Doudnabacteria bacterium]